MPHHSFPASGRESSSPDESLMDDHVAKLEAGQASILTILWRLVDNQAAGAVSADDDVALPEPRRHLSESSGPARQPKASPQYPIQFFWSSTCPRANLGIQKCPRVHSQYR